MSATVKSKHLTEQERKNKIETEQKLKGSSDNIKPPKHLSAKQKKIFKYIVYELVNSDILGNLDIYVLSTTLDKTIYVSTSGNDTTGNGSQNLPYKTVQKAIDSLPQIINHTINITISVETYSETITMSGFDGKGSINLSGADRTTTSSSSTVLSSEVSTYNNIISNRSYAIYSSNCSTITSNTNSGTGNVTGLFADLSGTIFKYGGQPTGTTNELVSGGVIR